MISNKRLTRLAIITVATITGGAFIALAVTSLDFPANKVLAQLMAVVILIVCLVALAALVAYGLRIFLSRRDNDNDEEQ